VESILGPLGTSAAEWPIVPAPGDCDDGEFGGMKIGRGNRSTRRKPAPAPLCPPQIQLDQAPGSNPGRHGGKPATNRLSYGAALCETVGGILILMSVFRRDVFRLVPLHSTHVPEMRWLLLYLTTRCHVRFFSQT
jgi:hypothetical protein